LALAAAARAGDRFGAGTDLALARVAAFTFARVPLLAFALVRVEPFAFARVVTFAFAAAVLREPVDARWEAGISALTTALVKSGICFSR
jgi:hypothetical protein